jgi:hypothetical protein
MKATKTASIALLALLSGCAVQQRRIDDTNLRLAAKLRSAKTIMEISALLQTGPTSCVPAGEDKQVCTWNRGSSETWHLASGGIVAPISIGWTIVVICEMPKDGSPRAEESCVAKYSEL